MAQITLPLVVDVVLLEVAVGGAFLIWALDRGRDAPPGSLKLIGAVDASCGVLAFFLLPLVPRGALAERAHLGAPAIESYATAVSVVAVLLIAQLITTFVPWRALRTVVSLVTLVAGGGALMAAAIARPSDAPFDVFALFALPLGAIALGGVDAAMLLGHWYLVTPRMTTSPLQRASLIVAAAVLLQAVLVAVTFARGELVGASDASLTVALGIRIGVGIAMTFGLALGAWWTARMNTQSSTGLLYVALGTVIAGEIAARVVFYVTGAAV